MTNTLPVWFIFVIFLGLGINALSGWLSGRTARSKGYSFGLFFGLSFVSWFVMATIAVFIKPRKGIAEADASRKSLSWILYFLGLGAYLLGGFVLTISSMGNSNETSTTTFSWLAAIGGVSLLAASIGLILAATGVANNKNGHAEQNFEISI
jgi:uncharacterized membrane protein